ncbi:MAG: hypothetical protein GY707_12485 [Desulfobacteraceae bacterium]|nr:hypothetical protein [Desulfobacteraceae bacterium]
MNTKILRYISLIIFIGLFTVPGWTGTQVPTVKTNSKPGQPLAPEFTEAPNPKVTVSFVIYKGPNPEVTVSTVVYKGKDIKIGKASSMKISVKKHRMEKRVKIVLISPRNQVFKSGARVPLKVNVSNPPETKVEPGFEFQQLNGRTWRKIHGQRVTGHIVKRFKEKITLTRYIKFKKAGIYRWRCKINKGVWSGWSDVVKVIDPNTRTTPGSPNTRTVPGRATNSRQ